MATSNSIIVRHDNKKTSSMGIKSSFYDFRSNFLFWHVFLSLQWSVADDVEVVKSVTSEDLDKRDEGGDQVALESEHQEQHIHPPPPHIVQGNLNYFLDFPAISHESL